MPSRILIIEDAADIVEVVTLSLEREGMRVWAAGDGRTGLQLAIAQVPDLILLDLMLPKLDGLSVCRELRQHAATKRIPIVMLTAKEEESDVIVGLEMGADDYVVKPFSPKELVARVRAILRRAATPSADAMVPITLGPLVIDTQRYVVQLAGQALTLTRTEFRLLVALARAPERVFTRDQLIDQITGGEAIIIDRNVDVHIRALRKKLGTAGELIRTVRGVGYKIALEP